MLSIIGNAITSATRFGLSFISFIFVNFHKRKDKISQYWGKEGNIQNICERFNI